MRETNRSVENERNSYHVNESRRRSDMQYYEDERRARGKPQRWVSVSVMVTMAVVVVGVAAALVVVVVSKSAQRFLRPIE